MRGRKTGKARKRERKKEGRERERRGSKGTARGKLREGDEREGSPEQQSSPVKPGLIKIEAAIVSDTAEYLTYQA